MSETDSVLVVFGFLKRMPFQVCISEADYVAGLMFLKYIMFQVCISETGSV